MELIKVGEKTYYIKNPTNIGIYKVDDNNVYLIDSGNSKDAGKKILKIINEQGWNVKGIINTHSHADHIGGNKLIEDRTNCDVYASNIEQCFVKYPVLEPALLYGGCPFKDLTGKFLQALKSNAKNIEESNICGIEYIPLKGHSINMIGVKTSDDIIFLGDSLFSKDTINKYHVFFIYDVKEYLNTLSYLKTLKCKLFIPSHCEATNNIDELIELNKNKIDEILDLIYDYCKNNVTFEEILKYIFDKYSLNMEAYQYVLVGSTIKSYLSYLYDENRITYEFIDNKMLWKQKEEDSYNYENSNNV